MDSICPIEDPTAPRSFGERRNSSCGRSSCARRHAGDVGQVTLLMSKIAAPDVIPAAQRMIAVYPNVTSSHMFLGICLMFDGRAADAIPEYEQTIRLDPRNAQNIHSLPLMGYALLFLDRYDEAIVWFQKSLAANPSDSPRNRGNIRAAIAAAQALAGRNQDARASAAEAMRLWPTLTARSYYPITRSQTRSLPRRSPACETVCGLPAFAIMPTRTPIRACPRMTSCTPTMRRRHRSPCLVHGPSGRLTWPR